LEGELNQLLILLFFMTWAALSTIAHGDENSVESFETPVREVAVILTPEGAYPSSIFAYKGEKIRFYLSATTKRPSCFMVPQHNVFVAVPPGEVREASLVLKHKGELEFHCPTGNIKGALSVHEHPRDIRKRRQRELASEQERNEGPRIWMPQDDMKKLYDN
jgi:hypothetical protein